MAIFTLIAAATHLISWGAAALSLAATAFSVAYQQHRANKLKAEMDKRKQVNVAIDGEPFYLPVVYGRAQVSGGKTRHKLKDSFVYAATPAANKKLTYNMSSSKTGSKNEYLFVQQAICYGGINNVIDVIVDEKNWDDTTLQYGQDISIYYNGGIADPLATANGIPSTNTFTNAAYASFAFRLNREEYNYNGSPNVSFFVEGAKVYDITFSGGVYALSVTKSFTTNPARILLDYLTNTVYGKGLSLSSIDLSSFYKAKLICDRVVRTSVAVDGRVNGRRPDVENEDGSITSQPAVAPRDIKLYECNVVLDTERPFRENIELILESMSEADLIWSGGTYKLSLEAPTSTAEQTALVKVAFTESDIIRGKIELSWPDSSSRYAQVTARFRNEFENFVDDSVTWPTTFTPAYNTYLSEDSNILLKTEVYLPCTSDPYHALAKAEQMVRFSRKAMMAKFTVGKAGLLLEPGDIISVTEASSSLLGEIMKVQSVKLSSELTAEIEAVQYDYTTFAWNVSDTLAYSNKLSYYYRITPPSNVIFTPSTSGLYGASSGTLSWTYPNDVSVSEFLIEVSADSGTTWKVLGTSLATNFQVIGLNNGVYQFSVKSKTPGGKYSTRVLAYDASLVSTDFTIQKSTTDQVAIVYANTADSATNTQSFTMGSNQYVAYYVYSSNPPSLPIRSGITFAKFVGDNGAPGETGTSAYQVNVYRRNATAPTTPTGGSYNFSTAVLTPPTLWFSTPPAGTSPLYVSTSTASVFGNVLIDDTLTWSTPAILVQDGTAGSPGANNAVVTLYAKNTSSSSAPASFTGTATYTFSTGAITGLTLNTWSVTPPALSSGEYLWIRQAIASSTSTTDTIAIGEWTAATVLSYAGSNGINGTNGLNSMPLFLYIKNTSTTAPALFSGTATYTFSSGILSGLTLNGWSQTAPSIDQGEYLWVSRVITSTPNDVDTILIGEWSTPVISGIGGTNGSQGVAGTRGAGWWRYDAVAADLSALTQTDIDNYWLALHTPDIVAVKDDRFIIATTHASGTKAFIYDGVDWVSQASFIDGGLLVTGTITGNKLAANSIITNSAQINDLTVNRLNLTLGSVSSYNYYKYAISQSVAAYDTWEQLTQTQDVVLEATAKDVPSVIRFRSFVSTATGFGLVNNANNLLGSGNTTSPMISDYQLQKQMRVSVFNVTKNKWVVSNQNIIKLHTVYNIGLKGIQLLYTGSYVSSVNTYYTPLTVNNLVNGEQIIEGAISIPYGGDTNYSPGDTLRFSVWLYKNRTNATALLTVAASEVGFEFWKWYR
jgi:hypothetical protein